MDRSDLLFKRACQHWHDRFGRCVKEANTKDAQQLQNYVEHQLVAWKRHQAAMRIQMAQAERALVEARKKEASARSRLQILGHLHAFMKQGERKINVMVKAAATAAKQQMEIEAEEAEELMEHAAEASGRPGGDDGHQEE